MQKLPIGFPKLLVSTMAAGDVSAFVGTSDIAMMYSVVDIAGINAVSSSIFGNAAAGVAGMAAAYEVRVPAADTRPLVGATMYGTTTPCVNTARAALERLGYEVLVFHATGTGGRSMEALMKSGYITASLDVTTTELIDEIAGGTLTAGPDRLEAAGARIATGGIHRSDRPNHLHSPAGGSRGIPGPQLLRPQPEHHPRPQQRPRV